MSTKARPKAPERRIRSAFAPIQPNGAAIAASGQERGQPEVKSRETATSAAPATVKIDLLCGLIPPSDTKHRTGVAVSYFTRGKGATPRGIAVLLNPRAAIVARALERGDQAMAAFLVATAFSEFMFLRRKNHPLVELLQARLAANVYGDPSSANRTFWLLTALACGLADKLLAPQMPWPLTRELQTVRSFHFEVPKPDWLELPWGNVAKPKVTSKT